MEELGINLLLRDNSSDFNIIFNNTAHIHTQMVTVVTGSGAGITVCFTDPVQTRADTQVQRSRKQLPTRHSATIPAQACASIHVTEITSLKNEPRIRTSQLTRQQSWTSSPLPTLHLPRINN
ncbi:hypothetical protein KC19_1G117100 [Ceratodon purpureus]|uniref:Uncharacterized protein n=1 Tax=Ceratodon purpureus TaxID=3225 RepID=A0A8T0J544_CERPU|nr:hypothetical protein KC19_1G117100 [Ceratodon purpureus]